jgi:CBS domain containing-hemolysin-like protein
MYPVIAILNTSANWMLRIAGLDAVHEHEHSYSADELKLIIRSSRAPARYSRGEWDMLAHVIEFAEMNVRDILKPATELVAIYTDQPFAENMKTVIGKRYSRYPMLEKVTGKVFGVLHVKDLIDRSVVDNQQLMDLLRPALLVREQTPAVELLNKFRIGNSAHLAIVPDVSGIVGFVTFDDLLAALLGVIHDEFSRETSGWKRLKGGSYRGSASLPIYTLERRLGVEIPSESAGSISGLIMEKLQRLPEKGETIEFKHFQIKVLSMRGPRILSVKVIPGSTLD